MGIDLKQVVFATGLFFSAAMSLPAHAVVKGDVLPAIAVKGHTASELNQASMQGKVTMINFWATWCAACKVEIKEMEEQFKAFAGDKDFQMAYVSLDKDPAKAVEWFSSNLKDPQAMLKHLYMDQAFAAAEALKVESFPMTFIVDRSGKVSYLQAGFKEGENSTEEMAKVIAQALRQ